MSLLPYVVNEMLRDTYDPFSRLYDQHFGVGMLNDDLFRRTPALFSGYLRPHRFEVPEDSGISTIANQKDQFKVSNLGCTIRTHNVLENVALTVSFPPFCFTGELGRAAIQTGGSKR